MIRRYDNKGVALFITLAILFLLSLAAIVVLLTAYNYANITENQIKRLRALTVAESGIHYAYWRLRNDPTFSGATITPDPNGPNAEITVTGPVGGRYTVESRVSY